MRAPSRPFPDGYETEALGELAQLPPQPEGFEIGDFRPGSSGDLVKTWAIKLRRTNAPLAYGSYTITFDEHGYSPGNGSLVKHKSIDPYRAR